MSTYSSRRTSNSVALSLAVVAAVVGLFFLFAILATLLYKGFTAITPQMFLESTPPPGDDGGLLNAIFGSVAMTVIAVVVATPIGILAGTYLTEYSRGHWLGEAAKFGLTEEKINKEKAVGQLQRDNFRKAWQAGVKMAFGTDASVCAYGTNGKQFAYMVKRGMTPMQAIQAATSNAADLLGKSSLLGSVKAGRYADLVAVEGDPLADISLLENVKFVMKDSRVYKQ